MADVLIRNVDDDDLRLIDALAAHRGLSRNELLRRETHRLAHQQAREAVTVEELRASLSLSSDLIDEGVMRGAWE